MNSDPDPDSARGAPACAWCGATLTPEERERPSPACDRCARKLRDSGLSEEEIYGAGAGGGDDE